MGCVDVEEKFKIGRCPCKKQKRKFPLYSALKIFVSYWTEMGSILLWKCLSCVCVCVFLIISRTAFNVDLVSLSGNCRI